MGLFNGHLHRNPKMYSNPKELAKAIDEYVDSIQEGKFAYTKKDGREIEVYRSRPSIPGLCLHLNMSSKRQLVSLALSGNDMLKAIIETAFLWIEAFYVEQMQTSTNIGAYQFLLTNMGYKRGDVDKPMLPSAENVGSAKSSSISETPHKLSDRRILINLVESKDSLPDHVVRAQLKEMGGADAEILTAIDEEFQLRNGGMRQIEAEENIITQKAE